MEIIIPMHTNIKECQHCTVPFISQRKTAKFCSNNCKQMAYLKRNGFTTSLQSPLVKKTVTPKRKDGMLKRFLKLLW